MYGFSSLLGFWIHLLNAEVIGQEKMCHPSRRRGSDVPSATRNRLTFAKCLRAVSRSFESRRAPAAADACPRQSESSEGALPIPLPASLSAPSSESARGLNPSN